jgi:hypothetical protein
MLPKNAKRYIAVIVGSGLAALLLAAASWQSTNLRQFFVYLGLAALASTLKVRIPGVEGTMSPNFVFILLAIVALPFSNVVAISLAAALVQTLWASAKRVRLVQVTFSAAALVLSSSIAYAFSHFLYSANSGESAVVRVILAGSIYFPVNSALVAVVIGLAEGQSLKQVCQHCYEWEFPYFMGGIAFAGLVSGAYTPSALWKGALLLFPAAVLAYAYFLTRSRRPTVKGVPVVVSEEECPVEIHS